MKQPQHEFWYARSRWFHLVWFSFLGGMMVLGYAFDTGKDYVHQLALQLSKFCSEDIILQIARMDLTRQAIPVHLCLSLGFLSPLLGICAYHMMVRSELPIMEQEDVLVRTHVRSLLIITPVLLLCGVAASLIKAYFKNPYMNLNDLINFTDYIRSLYMSLTLGITLSGLAFFEIKLLYKSAKLKKQIAVCVVSILVNYFAIIAVYFGIMYMAKRFQYLPRHNVTLMLYGSPQEVAHAQECPENLIDRTRADRA
jgi:hypothetical protein